MVKKTGLLKALDAHKGRDYEAEKKKKQLKAGEKRKRERTEAAETSEAEDIEKMEVKKNKKAKSSKSALIATEDIPAEDSASEFDEDGSSAEDIPETNGTIPQPLENNDASASEADPESDVPLSDLEEEDLEDAIPHQRLTINNGPALLASTKRVTIAKPKMPFHYHNSLVSDLPPASTAIPDPNDDLTRELEFYRIARDGVVSARTKLKKEKVPFTRPTDYFAEMAKSEDHMGKVKKKMYDQAAGKKASEEARKLRDAKKFGKAVQIAKEQERAKEKRTMLDNIKELKKKRKGQAPTSTNEPDDLFQEIAVEDENPKKRDRTSSGGGSGRGDSGSSKRQKRDSKYGFGGKKRFAKSGDAMSSADISGFSARGMKSGGRGGGSSSRGGAGMGRGRGGKRGAPQRPGKSRRASGRS